MFHVAAFTGLIDNTANSDVPALTDDIMYIQNGHFLPQQDMYLLGAFAASATLSRSRIKTPKLLQISPEYIRPINVGVLPANNSNMPMWYVDPPKLSGIEEIVNEATSGVAMGTERYTSLLWMSDKPNPDPVPAGDQYTVRFTSTSTAVVNTWTSIAVTFEQQVISGRYAVALCELQATNIIAFRMIFDQQYWRPGMIGINALGNRLPYDWYKFNLGVWGFFKTISLPRFQVLCNAANTAFEGYLTIKYLGK